MHFPILSAIILLPIIGALFIFIFARENDDSTQKNIYLTALWSSLATFFLTMAMMIRFDPNLINFQFEEQYKWIDDYNISYHLGVDGISIFFILLTALLTPICILASKGAITKRVKEYMIAFLLLESFVIGTFAALDFMVFYILRVNICSDGILYFTSYYML